MYTAMASADLIIDIIVILLPMPILWTLQLKTSKKVLLTAVFGLGFLYGNFNFVTSTLNEADCDKVS
jgi:hypothetical protein